MYWDTIALAYQPRRKKAVRNQIQVKAPNHSNCSSRNSQTNTNLMIEFKISVPDVVILQMHQDLIAQQRIPMQTLHQN